MNFGPLIANYAFMTTRFHFVFGFSLALISLFSCGAAAAEGVVCAQYMPCDSDGNIWPSISSEDACYPQYLEACQMVATKKLSDKFQACEQNGQQYQKTIEDLRRKIASLERRARVSKKRP